MEDSKSNQWMLALVAIVAVVSIVTMTLMGRGSSAPSGVYVPAGVAGASSTLGGQAYGGYTERYFDNGDGTTNVVFCMRDYTDCIHWTENAAGDSWGWGEGNGFSARRSPNSR